MSGPPFRNTLAMPGSFYTLDEDVFYTMEILDCFINKKLLQAAKAVSAAVFRLLFSRSDSLVETFHESVNVDAVCQGTLLDVLKMSSSAAEAAHAGIHEYLYGIRIFLNDFHDAHVFCDCHVRTLLNNLCTTNSL